MAIIQLNKVKQLLYRFNIKQSIIVFIYIYDDKPDVKIICEYELIDLK